MKKAHRPFCAALGSRRTDSSQQEQNLFPGHEAGVGGPSEPLKGELGEGPRNTNGRMDFPGTTQEET